MRNAGPPWSTPSQDPRGYQPQPTGYQSSGYQPQSSYEPQSSGYQPQSSGYQPQPARNAWPDGYAATDGDGSRAAATSDGRHARPRRGRVARLATTSAVVIVLAGAAAVVGFLARSSPAAKSAPPASGLAVAPAPTSAAPTGVPAANGAAKAPGAAKTPSTAGSVPAGLGSSWKLTFNAGFTGSKLDTSVWGTCYPWQPQSGCANFGNSTLEYQWYAASQDQVSNGALHIVAQAEPITGRDSGGGPETYPYRSGLVTSFPGYKFQYGYLQVVARVPNALGTWSALWLAAANEEWPPEIDILEHWGTDTKYYQYYHPAGAPRENGVETLGNLSTSWHTYGVYWSQSKVVWYIDGRQVFESVRNVPQQPMYFLANVAVESHVQSLNTSMDIKSISVWQQAG
ncbi:MAG TPA: family 16 glycosylhydrolase [Trebonia sp.]|nr:family 16 glycosylhydrolase [Trebonia sp.]